MSRSVLSGRLARAERVVQISAPAGSGKTMLIRSWIARSGLAARAAWVSVNTVSTHTRHLYAKLGVHSRQEAVERARALGLLAPAARKAHPAIT